MIPAGQTPPLPPDWANSLPAWVVAFAFLVGVGVWAAKQLGFVRTNGNGKPGQIVQGHKTFADNEDRYWQQMREVVTAPLAEVLRGTNTILTELRDRAIREDGRQDEARRRRS